MTEPTIHPVADLVLADDHAVFVDAMSIVLARQGFVISAVAHSVVRAIEAVGRYQPRICVVDRHFQDGDGIEAISLILAACPRTKVLVLSADRDHDAAARALRAGASGYLHKTRTVDALAGALGRILRGELVVEVPNPPTANRSARTDDAHRLAAHLTARERQCLALLVEGMDTTAMVTALGVSRTTVRTHVQSLLAKLGVHSRLEAASFAVRHRLLADEPVPAREARAI
ncbi:MAG TPA: response regulator transcription factor [Pseudonocardiaceae bacterium]|nr:response regulator transcription factor [Pseudonocardiaceae bacterium]